MHDPQLLEDAMRLYVRTVGIIDPLRVRTWKELELTVTQLRVLFILRETPGAPAGLLAERLRVTPPTVTGLVDRLVRMGVVRREEDAKDRGALGSGYVSSAASGVGRPRNRGAGRSSRRCPRSSRRS